MFIRVINTPCDDGDGSSGGGLVGAFADEVVLLTLSAL